MKKSDNHKTEYGERILMLRNHLGLKLEKFSEPLSVSFKTVSNYENGDAKPSEAIVRQLEDIYLMNRKWFETGEGEMIRTQAKPEVAEPDEPYSGDQRWVRLNKLWNLLCEQQRDTLLAVAEGFAPQQQKTFAEKENQVINLLERKSA